MKFFQWFGILIIFSYSGCDSLFSTREPEQPISRQSNWIPPISPQQVVLNMQNAVYERNVDNYIRCLIDSAYSIYRFSFFPDLQIAADHAAVFLDWDRRREQSVMKQAFSLVPAVKVSNLIFTDETWEITSSDQAIFGAQYTLELQHSQTSLDTIFKGYATWNLAQDNRGEWAIHTWIDNQVTNARSWSFLKAILGG